MVDKRQPQASDLPDGSDHSYSADRARRNVGLGYASMSVDEFLQEAASLTDTEAEVGLRCAIDLQRSNSEDLWVALFPCTGADLWFEIPAAAIHDIHYEGQHLCASRLLPVARVRFKEGLESLASTFTLLSGSAEDPNPYDLSGTPDKDRADFSDKEALTADTFSVARRPTLNQQLRREYEELFRTCAIRTGRAAVVQSMVNKIQANKERCVEVEGLTGVPWYIIAVLQAMEASLDFSRHLHNGDPLTARTVRVPRGRPPHGNPPFSWKQSALDALEYDQFTSWQDWTVPGILFKFEGYNGWGYRRYHPQVLTPYLWSFSNHYTRGKYIADGRWSATAVSEQCGAAVLLRRMMEQGLINL